MGAGASAQNPGDGPTTDQVETQEESVYSRPKDYNAFGSSVKVIGLLELFKILRTQ